MNFSEIFESSVWSVQDLPQMIEQAFSFADRPDIGRFRLEAEDDKGLWFMGDKEIQIGRERNFPSAQIIVMPDRRNDQGVIYVLVRMRIGRHFAQDIAQSSASAFRKLPYEVMTLTYGLVDRLLDQPSAPKNVMPSIPDEREYLSPDAFESIVDELVNE